MGDFVYAVTAQRIVWPDARDIVNPGSIGELVLTTCNPKFSAAQRPIIIAEPKGES